MTTFFCLGCILCSSASYQTDLIAFNPLGQKLKLTFTLDIQAPSKPSEESAETADTKMKLDKSDNPVGDVKEEKMEVEKEKNVENEKPVVLLSGLDNTEGKMTEIPGECSHLVMSKLSRTNNFLLFALVKPEVRSGSTSVSPGR